MDGYIWAFEAGQTAWSIDKCTKTARSKANAKIVLDKHGHKFSNPWKAWPSPGQRMDRDKISLKTLRWITCKAHPSMKIVIEIDSPGAGDSNMYKLRTTGGLYLLYMASHGDEVTGIE